MGEAPRWTHTCKKSVLRTRTEACGHCEESPGQRTHMFSGLRRGKHRISGRQHPRGAVPPKMVQQCSWLKASGFSPQRKPANQMLNHLTIFQTQREEKGTLTNMFKPLTSLEEAGTMQCTSLGSDVSGWQVPTLLGGGPEFFLQLPTTLTHVASLAPVGTDLATLLFSWLIPFTMSSPKILKLGSTDSLKDSREIHELNREQNCLLFY